MREIKQGSAPVITFFVSQPDGFFSDQALGSPLLHGEGVTGLTSGYFTSYQISKNGADFGVITPSGWNEVGNGWYSVTLAAGDTNTLGDLVFHVTVTGYPAVEQIYNVVANIESDVATLVWDAAIGEHITDNTTGKTVYTLASKFPANYLMGSSITGDKDTTIDAIDAITSQFTFETEGVNAVIPNIMVNTTSAVQIPKDESYKFRIPVRTSNSVVPPETITGWWLVQRSSDNRYFNGLYDPMDPEASWTADIAEGLLAVNDYGSYEPTIGLYTCAWIPDGVYNATYALYLVSVPFLATVTVNVTEHTIDDVGDITDQITFDESDGGINSHGLNAPVIDYAAIADAVWNEDITDHTTPDSAGQDVADIKAKTDNLPSEPASKTDVKVYEAEDNS